MQSRKIKIMPYVFVCGSGILNLLLMSMPFLNFAGLNMSGYIMISAIHGWLGTIITIFQLLIMLLVFTMVVYGTIGILYSCGVAGVNMDKRYFRLLCAVPVVLLVLMYFLQFIFIITFCAKYDYWVGVGVYMSFFLNIAVAIIYPFLLKTPSQQQNRRPVIHFNEEPTIENHKNK